MVSRVQVTVTSATKKLSESGSTCATGQSAVLIELSWYLSRTICDSRRLPWAARIDHLTTRPMRTRMFM